MVFHIFPNQKNGLSVTFNHQNKLIKYRKQTNRFLLSKSNFLIIQYYFFITLETKS